MAGTKRKQTTAGKSKAGGSGKKVKNINEEALNLVDDRATEIARSLYDRTLIGNTLSVRLLVGLAKENTHTEEAVLTRPHRSLATHLAAEPEWPGEADMETGVGSREPEGA
jgi:hypothetical protein